MASTNEYNDKIDEQALSVFLPCFIVTMVMYVTFSLFSCRGNDNHYAVVGKLHTNCDLICKTPT